MADHDFEPAPGLPAPLPAGEEILWQGQPDRKALAREAHKAKYKANWILGYMGLIALWRGGAARADGGAAGALAHLVPYVVLALAAWGVVQALAWAQAVTVRDAQGNLLTDLPHGGFITVIQNAMARERTVAGVQGNPPVKIVRYQNGRLVAEDPATGWSAELYAFGDDNKAAFERLLSTD
jgi:putative photosynthetic complex assembly protein